MPSYNRAHVLRRALDSVVGQTYPAREIVVVDDGSSDATAAIVHEYADVTYRYTRHCGVSAARNLGVRSTRSDWVAFLDSDDAWHPDKLARQRAAITRSPVLELFHCDETWIRDGRELRQKAHHAKHGGDLFERGLALCVISPSAAVVRRRLFEQMNGFDESLKACEDYDLWLRICANHPVGFVTERLVVKYGGHADQLSRRTPVLDRYRIKALVKLLEQAQLTDTQRGQVAQMLRRKVGIVMQGAAKRGRRQEICNLRHVLMKYCDEHAS